MNELRDRLDRWVDAGLITAEQAAAIDAHERARPGVTPAPVADSAQPASAARGRTTAAEAIGYVGAALAIGAVVLLLGEVWSDLLVAGRLAILATLTAALAGSAGALRRVASPAMSRLRAALFVASIAGAGWFAGVVASDVAELSGDWTGVVVGATVTAAAVALYATTRHTLLQVATLVGVMILVISALQVPQLPVAAMWHGVSISSIGAAWLLTAYGGWHTPRWLASVTGAGLVLVGAQVASYDEPRWAALTVGLVAAGLLVAAAIRFDALHLLVVGAVGTFVLVPQLVFDVFGDVIGAPATLLLVGLLLVLLAVGIGRVRREVGHAARPTGKEVASDG